MEKAPRSPSLPISPRTVVSRLADQDLPPALRNHVSDHAAMVLRGTLGSLPVGGALVTELIGRILPNLREERLCTYVAGLARKLEATQKTLDELLAKTDAEKAALFEDGASGAVRATTEQRIQQLVDLVAEGLEASGREAEDQRSIVRLLNELTETDLRYLMLWTKKFSDDRDWRRKHGFDVRFEDRDMEIPFGDSTRTVRTQVPVGDVMDAIAEMSIQGRLESLGLFEKQVVQTDPPVLDSVTGDMTNSGRFEYSTNISEQGLELLRRLKLIGKEDGKAHLP